MRRFAVVVTLLCTLLWTAGALAASAGADDDIGVQDMVLTVPDGWKLQQDAKDAGTIILGFASGAEYLTLYVKQETSLNMQGIFANDARIEEDVRQVTINDHDWNRLDSSKSFGGDDTRNYVASFLTELNGYSYYGYARTDSLNRSREIVGTFLDALR